MSARPGRVVATMGRRVVVRDAEGERVCFLAGKRAVVGDEVHWVVVPGDGGKLVSVSPRRTALVRTDLRAKEQVLAANLHGIVVVTAPQEPPFRAGLLDRYVVAAGIGGLDVLVVLNKVDRGVPDEVASALAVRAAVGVRVLQVSAHDGTGLGDVHAALADVGPWALVGHSGVGKTSLAAVLVPGQDVGAVGDLSAHWGTGQHTTTGSRVFALPGGGELVDSPGIRTFAPGRLEPVAVRTWFPAVREVQCKYRDCLHREGEDGCDVEAVVAPELVTSYRRLLTEIEGIEARRAPGRRRSRT